MLCQVFSMKIYLFCIRFSIVFHNYYVGFCRWLSRLSESLMAKKNISSYILYMWYFLPNKLAVCLSSFHSYITAFTVIL